MRLCTLLEGADHPCVFVPLAICPLSGMEAVLMPLSDSCNLEVKPHPFLACCDPLLAGCQTTSAAFTPGGTGRDRCDP